jgi:glutamine amidotransferase PdxT
MHGTEYNMVQFMDMSVTKNTWGRRQYGTVYGSVGHKKYVGQKTIWYSLWIYRSQIIRGAEDNMVEFMDLSVTKNTIVFRAKYYL